MSRAPVFVFDHPEYAVAFARAISAFQSRSVEWAESTSEHAQLRSIKPTVIRSQVHLFCTYHCGSATGQNMVTKPPSMLVIGSARSSRSSFLFGTS
jgi:hydroxymethylglutaryl-CoA reductase